MREAREGEVVGAATARGAIDVVVFPFTPETKADPYEHTRVLKDSLLHLGIWDREFTATQLVEQMDAASVEKVLLCAQAGGSWEVSYDYIRQMMNEAPDRILGTAGIDPRDVAAGVRKLEQAVGEWGFVGAHSYPHWFRLSPATVSTTLSTGNALNSTFRCKSRSGWHIRRVYEMSGTRPRLTQLPSICLS